MHDDDNTTTMAAAAATAPARRPEAGGEFWTQWEFDPLGELHFTGITFGDGHTVRCTEMQSQDPRFLAAAHAEYLARRAAEDACGA